MQGMNFQRQRILLVLGIPLIVLLMMYIILSKPGCKYAELSKEMSVWRKRELEDYLNES